MNVDAAISVTFLEDYFNQDRQRDQSTGGRRGSRILYLPTTDAPLLALLYHLPAHRPYTQDEDWVILVRSYIT